MLKRFFQVLRDEGGQGMAEYGLILALIAVAVIVTLTLLGGAIRSKFQDVKGAIEQSQPQ